MTEPDDLQPVDDGEDDDTEFATIAGATTIPVSYTHLTLPTIYSV